MDFVTKSFTVYLPNCCRCIPRVARQGIIAMHTFRQHAQYWAVYPALGIALAICWAVSQKVDGFSVGWGQSNRRRYLLVAWVAYGKKPGKALGTSCATLTSSSTIIVRPTGIHIAIYHVSARYDLPTLPIDVAGIWESHTVLVRGYRNVARIARRRSIALATSASYAGAPSSTRGRTKNADLSSASCLASAC
jgi:hypothetical protein